jgi:AraC-like DNA-binding protein
VLRLLNELPQEHRAIQEYLGRNYARADLGLAMIADAFRISENYLSSFYKEQTGEGLSTAFHRIRFDEAVRLLLETGETIDAIALKCGCLNTSSFRRAFKQRHGLSPSAFKTRRHPIVMRTATSPVKGRNAAPRSSKSG